MDRDWRSAGAIRHQRHHRRPEAARGMLQTGMKAERVWSRHTDAARGEIRSRCRFGGLPNGECCLGTNGVVVIGLAFDRRSMSRMARRTSSVLSPEAAPSQRRDDALLVAPGVA